MCGRMTQTNPKAMKDHYKLKGRRNEELLAELKERYNIAPSQMVPVVVEDNNETEIKMMKWGYMPVWAPDTKYLFKYSTFNARSEDIFEKRTWKDSIRLRRVLVPCTGFYEWEKRDDGKQPYFIHPEGLNMFSLAGLYGTWKDPNGEELETFSIVTTTPNKEMSRIHNRMPVILHPDDEMTWIDHDNDGDVELLSQLMRPYEDNSLIMEEWSREVNSPRTDNKSIFQPINSK